MGSIIVAFVALAAALAAWLVDKRRRVYADQPTTPAAAVFAGHNEVVGVAHAAQPLVARRTQTPSVYWSYVLEEERRHTSQVTETDSNGNTSTRSETHEQWHQIESDGGQLSVIEVVDASGSAVVRTKGANIVERQFYRQEFRRDNDRGFFARLGDNRTGKYRETERGIAIGDQLFVAGMAYLDTETAVPFLGDSDGPFLISTKSEDAHTSNLGIWLVLLLVVFAVASVLANVLAFDAPALERPLTWLPGLAVALVGLFFAVWATTYNRLQTVGQSARRAWSLIDVQLERRAALIPNLASLIGAYVEHERSTLETVTRERAALPEDSEVTNAGATANEQTNTLRRIIGTIEQTPTLRANANFATMMADLADTENRIAGARTFYNDSVTLMRDRRQTFPGALVARLSPAPSRELFLPNGFERAAPEIEM